MKGGGYGIRRFERVVSHKASKERHSTYRGNTLLSYLGNFEPGHPEPNEGVCRSPSSKLIGRIQERQIMYIPDNNPSYHSRAVI